MPASSCPRQMSFLRPTNCSQGSGMDRFTKVTRWLLIICCSLFWGGCAVNYIFRQIAIDAEGNPIRIERLKP